MAVPLIVSHAPHLGAEVGTNAQTHTCAVNMHMPHAYAYTHVHMCTCRRDGPKSLHRNCGIKITNYLFFFLATGQQARPFAAARELLIVSPWATPLPVQRDDWA